jgi:hypothetical protein
MMQQTTPKQNMERNIKVQRLGAPCGLSRLTADGPAPASPSLAREVLAVRPWPSSSEELCDEASASSCDLLCLRELFAASAACALPLQTAAKNQKFLFDDFCNFAFG